MNSYIFVYAQDPIIWWVAPGGEVVHGKLEELAFKAKDHSVVVILPLGEVTRLPISITAKSRAQLQAAVPYALEEQLLSPVEELHFVLSADQHHAFVVEQERMQTIKETLEEKDIHMAHCVPEMALYPDLAKEQLVSVLPEQVVLTNAAGSVVLAAENAVQVVQALASSQDTEVNHVQVFPEADVALATQLATALECQPVTVTKSYFATLAEEFSPAAVNLLQGPYRVQNPWFEKSKVWWPSLGLAACLVAVYLGFLGYENYQLRQQTRTLNQEIEQVYKEAFPGATVVNAKVQMEQKLASIGGVGEAHFSPFLSATGKALLGVDTVQTKSISYRNKRLSFELQAAAIEPLEKITASLKQKYQAEMKSVNMVAGKVHAALEVTR